MSKFSKKFVVFALIGLSLAVASSAHAEEAKKDNSFTGFWRKLFNYPGKAVQSTADTTGHALSNTGEKVFDETGKNISEGRPLEAVAQPVVGAVQTTGQAGAEAGRMPVTAAEEASKAADAQAS
jgi:hypothetical protein